MNSVISFEALYLSLAGGVGTLQAVHLFFSKRKNHFANRILAFFLLSIIFINLLNWLWLTGLLIQVPHLFRSGRPLSYIFAPLIYIYLRASLQRENRFRKYDWILFIPTILVYFEFLPFYISPTLYKIQCIVKAINSGIDSQDGLLIGQYHGLLFIFFDVVVAYLIFLTVKKYSRNKQSITLEEQRIIKWVSHLMIVSLLVLMIFLLFWIINVNLKTILTFYFIQNASVVYFVSAYLLIKPTILDGVFPEEIFERRIQKRTEIFPLEKYKEYDTIVERLINEERIFLKQRLSLKQLSEISGISIHHLSAFVNRKYSMSFSDFINKLRIDYVILHLNSGEWRKYTLEGIAQEAGFASRTAFFSAFKKNIGISPSEFMKKKQVTN